MPSDTMLLDGYPAASPALPRVRPAAADHASSELCRAVLGQVLRQTVITRLRLAHPEIGGPAAEIARSDVDPVVSAMKLAGMLRRGSQAEVDACVESLLLQDDIDTLFVDIAPATHEAVQERDDAEDHAEATLAGWRLLEMIERLSPRFQAAAPARRHGHRVLLAEAETQGRRVPLQLTEECLSREGWDVWCEPRCTPAELVGTVGREWFALVALDAADVPVEQISALVRRVRRASCNRELRVLVISASLARRPDRMARLGADAAAADLRHACAQARRLLTLLPARV